MSGELWGVVYIPPQGGVYVDECLSQLAELSSQQLLLSGQAEFFMDRQVNILAPREVGTLGAWLSVWLDTPIDSMLLLDASQPPAPRLVELAAPHGRVKLLAYGPEQAFPAYYTRACQGAGKRLYGQGQRDLAVLLKVLRAPYLSVV